MASLPSKPSICVVGLGYVGLPLAAAFGKSGWKTYGFDVNAERIAALKRGHDWTNEVSDADLKKAKIEFSDDPKIIGKANTAVIAVPTPVDIANNPDLWMVMSATESVGKHMKKGTVVVYESTVYPGVTEDICVPILERHSDLKAGKDFWVGYSPERINPGDREHTIDKIVKVVAGQTPAVTGYLKKVYGKIVPAGIHEASNIKVAELAKALENTQRDLNIALINEIARLCDRLHIRTSDVLAAAGTKWNFLRFTPGLVGGHCIGVDPYYLVHKAKEVGMHTAVIAAGREMNDTMPTFIERQITRAMAKKRISNIGAKVLVLGLTFKENVPDTRNAKVHDLIHKLIADGCDVSGHDPHASERDQRSLAIPLSSLDEGPFDVIIAAVAHDEYRKIPASKFLKALKKPGIFYDLRSIWKPEEFEKAGRTYLSL